jgi:fermentation-respiration switch protein FrsA (DUF1100 family)
MPPTHRPPIVSRTVRRAIILLALLLIAAYGGILIWFRVNEDALVFHAVRGKLAAPAAELSLDSQDVPLQSDDGTPLVARLIPPPAGLSAATAGWILYLHGAGGNVGVAGYNEAWAKFRRLGLGVLAVDYRGFGESAGRPSEAGLYRDATGAYAYLTGRLGVSASRIVIYGYSLGSAVAIDLATRAPAAGLIVEGALLSVPARGAELYPFLPVAWLARNRFDSIEKVARVTVPKLFIHAREDTDVPIAHGRKLFDLAVPPKYFQDVAGGHRTAHQVDPGFFAAVARFVAGLGLPVIAP